MDGKLLSAPGPGCLCASRVQPERATAISRSPPGSTPRLVFQHRIPAESEAGGSLAPVNAISAAAYPPHPCHRGMACRRSGPARGRSASCLARSITPCAPRWIGCSQPEPASVNQTPVVSAAAMNLRWGAFLASGDERHIVSVLEALGSNEPGLATSARYALAQDAASHPRVLEICREQLDRQPQAIRPRSGRWSTTRQRRSPEPERAPDFALRSRPAEAGFFFVGRSGSGFRDTGC
jgi:hypothetical protein